MLNVVGRGSRGIELRENDVSAVMEDDVDEPAGQGRNRRASTLMRSPAILGFVG